jgi:YesN/AraC family two-component response regulator
VVTVSNGQEAVITMREIKADIVFMDIQMPVWTA